MLKEYTFICKRLTIQSSIEGLLIKRFIIKIIRVSVKSRVSYAFHKNHLHPRENFKTVLVCLDINSSRYPPSNIRQETGKIYKVNYAEAFLD